MAAEGIECRVYGRLLPGERRGGGGSPSSTSPSRKPDGGEAKAGETEHVAHVGNSVH